MNGIGNQILALLKAHGVVLVEQVDIMALCLAVFSAEMAGGGNQGALSAVIQQKDTIFRDPTLRAFAVALLQRLLPYVADSGTVHLVALAQQVPADAGGLA